MIAVYRELQVTTKMHCLSHCLTLFVSSNLLTSLMLVSYTSNFNFTLKTFPALVPKTTTPAPTTKLSTTTITTTTTRKPVSSRHASSTKLKTGKSTTLKSSAGKTTPRRKVTTGKISVTVTVPKKKPYKKGLTCLYAYCYFLALFLNFHI